MITDQMYAVFSADAYLGNNVPLKTGWRIYLTFPSDNGYAGTAYINDATGEVVIAHRGTDDATDWIDSNWDIFVDNTPAQFADAQAFITQVKNQLIIENRPANQITYTGHSLGGALAQMSVAWEYLNGNDIRAVVFDSPGVTLQMLQDAVGASFTNPGVLDIKNYVAAPDLVNTTNAHFSDLIRIYPVFSLPTFMSFGRKYSFRLNCRARNDNKRWAAGLAA